MLSGYIKTKLLPALAVLAYLIGISWRYYYIFITHRATDYVYSDMQLYVERALNFINPNYNANIADTIYPPGMHMLLGLIYTIDSSWEPALWMQFVISCLIPLLIAGLGYLLYGARVAYLALIFASLYFTFIDYAGFFLAENPYLFSVCSALLLLVLALRARARLWRIIAAICGGVMVAISAALKEAIIVPAALIGLFLLYLAWRNKSSSIFVILIASSLSTVAVLAPFSYRCTTLSEGAFCVTSNSGALTMLEGHHGEYVKVWYHDHERNLHFWFGPPPFAKRGYTGELHFDFGAYDARANRAAAWAWIKEHPWQAFLLSTQNVFQLFVGPTPWPSSDTAEKHLATFAQELFLVIVLLPALVFVWCHWRALLRLEQRYWADILVLLPVLGLMAAVFLSLGDPRYRIPFDGFIMLLAARMYLRQDGRLALPRAG
ncbi:MAG: hypothetical protein AB1810_08780 [Pseudomonadota bacterium]